MKDKQAAVIYRRVTRSWRAWYNSSYTITGEPIKMLELHYPMIQFLIINVTTGACGSNDSVCSKQRLRLSYYRICFSQKRVKQKKWNIAAFVAVVSFPNSRAPSRKRGGCHKYLGHGAKEEGGGLLNSVLYHMVRLCPKLF